MRRLLSAVLLLCLAFAAPASAKEVLSVKVCGSNGCETSRDRELIAAMADGGDPVDPPSAASPFFRVRLTIGDDRGEVVERFWTHFVPKGELIRGAEGVWMPATDAYTSALKKVVNPSMEDYPASRLAKIVAGDRPAPTYQAQVSSVVEPSQPPPAADDGGIGVTTIAPIAAGALALAGLVALIVRRRRRPVARPSLA